MTWSILKFSGEEIIKLAADIERAGKAFYEAAAHKVEDPEIVALFKALAGEEEKHISDFQALGKNLKVRGHTPSGNVPNINEVTPNESYVGEYGDYLKAIIDNHVFNINNVDSLVKGVVVAREALAIALRFEKDSILIFQEFLSAVDESGRQVVQNLIEQEKAHIRMLAHLNKIKW